MYTLAALKSEFSNDPVGMGYAPLWTTGQDGALAAKISAVSTGITVYAGLLPGYQIINATTPSEFLALTSANQNLYLAITGASGGVDSTNTLVRSAFTTMFAAGTSTRSALIAMAQRNGSRAEQVWGPGTTVATDDVSHCRAF